MSQPVIRLENVSKLYRIGEMGTGTISNDFSRWWSKKMKGKDPFAKIGQEQKEREGDFWALKDINFEVNQGDVLGIIGKNGAGKSTLLKILSRITSPTTGQVKIKGRIASLLEVGTGFHPELTGRDNVYLNGSFLGMKKWEIDKRFDEIIDFSGIEKFIDTPVKRYSSGMYVRLAFAVAAHLDPEILIIDEVLAVGDAEFQAKCLGKMKDVSEREGRTVLFVSHHMQAIATLTKNCIFLGKGKIISQGLTKNIIKDYLSDGIKNSLIYEDSDFGTEPKLIRLEVLTSEVGNTHIHGDQLVIEAEIFLPDALKNGGFALNIYNEIDLSVVHLWLFDSELNFLRKSGINKIKCVVPKFRLYMGKYSITAFLASNNGQVVHQVLSNICPFEVVMFKSERVHDWHPESCTYLEDFHWEVD